MARPLLKVGQVLLPPLLKAGQTFHSLSENQRLLPPLLKTSQTSHSVCENQRLLPPPLKAHQAFHRVSEYKGLLPLKGCQVLLRPSIYRRVLSPLKRESPYWRRHRGEKPLNLDLLQILVLLPLL